MKRTLLMLILFVSIGLFARNSTDIKALFIYQFTRLIDWPEDTKSGMFRIGVIGSFHDYKEIMEVAMGRNVGSQNIEVMNIMAINQLSLTDFHILVVGEAFCTPEKIMEINVQLKGKSTLLISNKVNFVSNDVCIGFEGDGQNFKYVYAFPSIKGKGLKCSQDFLLLGQKQK
ncbi:MAG: YfiR family protein [Salinivirgaceae bacterium]|jgi:hypothetical protein|nr:YfiR family protein [Salinivirgaceae bacterium]